MKSIIIVLVCIVLLVGACSPSTVTPDSERLENPLNCDRYGFVSICDILSPSGVSCVITTFGGQALAMDCDFK